MARQVLIIDPSASMRTIIKRMILAEINDAEVVESSDVSEAMDRLGEQDFHVVLFPRESANEEWLDFILQKRSSTPSMCNAFVLFTSCDQQGVLEEFQRYGVKEHLTIPCTSQALAETINRVCSIFTLRATRRYSLPGATAILEQGADSVSAEVVNFSAGGIMCELGLVESYKWTAPTMVTLDFPLENEKFSATGLYSATTRLTVAETHADFTPKRIRIALRFINVPPETKHVLEKIFTHIEQQEEMLGKE